MGKFFTSFLAFLGGLTVAILMIFGYAIVLSFFVKLLWNWVMVTKFNLPEINYFEAFGLYTLVSILFKSNYSEIKNNGNN